MKVNGAAQNIACQPGTWAVISRTWAPGDRVTIQIPMQLALAPIDEQHPRRVALTYGPVVLVRDQGPDSGFPGRRGFLLDYARAGGWNSMAPPSRTGHSCHSTRWVAELPTTCTLTFRGEIVARVSSPASSSSGNDESRVGTPDAVIDALQKDKEYRLIPGSLPSFRLPLLSRQC